MAATLRDKIALIYTSAGSLRRVAGLTGLSHQQVGRVLRGEYSPRAAILSSPDVRAAVDVAFSIHKDLTRQQARAHGLPYFPAAPVYMERLPMKGKRDGKRVLGDRVHAPHTHWLSNAQRDFFIALAWQSEKFVGASVRSDVNFVLYNKQADKRMRDLERARNSSEQAGKEYVTGQIKQQIIAGPIYTPMTFFSFDIRTVLDNINNTLMSKHAPATGDTGTSFAASVLLQVNHRESDNAEFRKSHPFPARKATRAKPRKNKKRR